MNDAQREQAPYGYGQRGVIDTALALRATGQAFALALVVEAEGSTYRKPGALAVVAEDGARVGVISGGCLEPGLNTLAREALTADSPRVAVFDTRGDDDLLFGSGSGCRGRMRVLTLPVRPGRACAALDAIAEAFVQCRSVTLPLSELAPTLFTEGRVDFRPPPHLLLLGAGPEAPPLLRIARTLGWYGSVADHREALLAPERMREADRILARRPGPALAELAGERLDAVLVMTHLAGADLEVLRALAARSVPYVGLLGPPMRRDDLLAQLEAHERTALHDRLHAPVGLRLGGEGPEAIALAIAAELQRAFHPRP
jgi:Xanthine and CO dehydrogenases maturation factor, XdhC/CoxF family